MIVVGSGPAGQRAAIQGAKSGKRVALVEVGLVFLFEPGAVRVAAGLSHRDIARRLGISPRHASRLYERGIKRAERAAAWLDRRTPA